MYISLDIPVTIVKAEPIAMVSVPFFKILANVLYVQLFSELCCQLMGTSTAEKAYYSVIMVLRFKQQNQKFHFSFEDSSMFTRIF
jgi:hypothetical protein